MQNSLDKELFQTLEWVGLKGGVTDFFGRREDRRRTVGLTGAERGGQRVVAGGKSRGAPHIASPGERESERERVWVYVRERESVWKILYIYILVFLSFSLGYFYYWSHGRGDRGEGETKVQPGLSHAADERQEGDELPAQLQRHLHASGAAPGWR